MHFDLSYSAPAATADLRRLSELEIGFMRHRNQAIAQLLDGQPVPPGVLETVQGELLPQCRRARAALGTFGSTDVPPALLPLLTRYVQMHEDAWESFVRAVQTRDVTLVQLHERLLADAQRLVHDIASSDEPAGPRQELRQFRNLLFTLTPHIWAIPALVAVNVAVWGVMVASGAGALGPPVQMMRDWGANSGSLTLNGQWWRTVTCTFLHFGLLHLGFNMYVLWQLGRLVERLVGNIGLLILYFATGIAASIASLAWNPDVTSAGASGAVFGVCGGLLGFIVLRRDSIPRVVLMDLKSSLITFVVYNVAFGAVVPAIDMAAHLGGLAYGFLCGLVLSQPLVPGADARRWRRNLAVLIGSAILLPLAFSRLPAAPPNLDAALARLDAANQRVAELYQQWGQQWQQGAIPDTTFAQAIADQMIPLLDQALQETQALGRSPHINKAVLPKLVQYFTARRESLQLLERGLRAGDEGVLHQHQVQWRAASVMERQLFPLRGP